jgi:uncharacterized phiE125 gp8 family phage protein
MMMVETAPAPDLAVNLDEVKVFLRIDGADEDALLAGLVRTATDVAEAFTGQKLLTRDFSQVMAALPTWQMLVASPVVAITGVEAANSALAGGDYEVDIDLAGDGWVRIIASPDRRATVRYRAGLADNWNGLPEALRLGIVRLVAHLYTHRDAADAGGAPAAVAALWRPWRRIRL